MPLQLHYFSVLRIFCSIHAILYRRCYFLAIVRNCDANGLVITPMIEGKRCIRDHFTPIAERAIANKIYHLSIPF